MTRIDPSRSPNRLAAVLLALLAAALAGLVVAFAISFNLADRQFRLAALAERQAAAVARIEARSQPNAAPDALRAALADYRALIGEETALVGADGALAAHQRGEAAAALRLERLALAGQPNAAFRTLVARITRQESEEIEQVRRELDHLLGRTVMLAIALAGAALLCATGAGWMLIRHNRSLEAVVRARTARLDAVDASRRLFFAKASHELRTPVTVLRGEAEVALLDPAAPAAALRASLAHVIASAAALGHRIDELLGLASADDGQLKLARRPAELCALIDAAVAEAGPLARSAEVTITAIKPGHPVDFQGDARWLRQALLAVIDNGLKFSPLGGVLSVALAVDGGTASICVTDRGAGVMPADLPRIFDAYYQSQESRQRGGSGLGLALARWVTEQHGGTIVAAGVPGGGCAVTLRLPLEGAE